MTVWQRESFSIHHSAREWGRQKGREAMKEDTESLSAVSSRTDHSSLTQRRKGDQLIQLQSRSVVTCRAWLSVVPSMRLCTVTPIRPTWGAAWSRPILATLKWCSITAIGTTWWLPSSTVWSWGMLAIGIMTSPVWSTLGRRSPTWIALQGWTLFLISLQLFIHSFHMACTVFDLFWQSDMYNIWC